MEPTIVKKNHFVVIGLEIPTTAKTLQTDIAKLWNKAAKLDLDNAIQERADTNLSLASIRNWSDTEPFTYFLGAEVEQALNVPEDCVIQTIPAATYAVFEMLGQAPNLIEPWSEIAVWLESSGNEWVIPMNFRVYDESTQGGKIYVPISVS